MRLEEENTKLKKLFAEATPRRACQVIGADRSSIRYCRRRPEDGPPRSRFSEIAALRRRLGYRMHILLRREGAIRNFCAAGRLNQSGHGQCEALAEE
jgi:hypothetical protein